MAHDTVITVLTCQLENRRPKKWNKLFRTMNVVVVNFDRFPRGKKRHAVGKGAKEVGSIIES